MKNRPTIVVVIFQLFFFFQLLSTIAVTSYTPVENFPVNCGNSGDVSSNDQRNWKGDDGSTLFSLIDLDKVSQSIKLEAQVRSNPSIPYDTARLSHSEFSNSFPVTDGQKFIRLYFYPSCYNPDSFALMLSSPSKQESTPFLRTSMLHLTPTLALHLMLLNHTEPSYESTASTLAQMRGLT